jgi:hypothetical protein
MLTVPLSFDSSPTDAFELRACSEYFTQRPQRQLIAKVDRNANGATFLSTAHRPTRLNCELALNISRKDRKDNSSQRWIEMLTVPLFFRQLTDRRV